MRLKIKDILPRISSLAKDRGIKLMYGQELEPGWSPGEIHLPSGATPHKLVWMFFHELAHEDIYVEGVHFWPYHKDDDWELMESAAEYALAAELFTDERAGLLMGMLAPDWEKSIGYSGQYTEYSTEANLEFLRIYYRLEV